MIIFPLIYQFPSEYKYIISVFITGQGQFTFNPPKIWIKTIKTGCAQRQCQVEAIIYIKGLTQYLLLYTIIFSEKQPHKGITLLMSQFIRKQQFQKGNPFRSIQTLPNWQTIKQALINMAQGTMNTRQIMESLAQFKSISYFHRFQKKRSPQKREFEILSNEYGQQLPEIFSNIAAFALREPIEQCPLFYSKFNQQWTFKKQQVLHLLCIMVLCLIPKQTYHQTNKSQCYNYQLDFCTVFSSSKFKTKSIIQYLKRELTDPPLSEKLTIKRCVIQLPFNELIKQFKDRKMCKITFGQDDEDIQKFKDHIKIDFANKFIGGGCLGHGCVQEEIMFANHPQLFITPLLCEAMLENQALMFVGFKKHNKSEGYGDQTQYAGQETVQYSFDKLNRAQDYIIAIDALCLNSKSILQYKRTNINREILKAFTGFSIDRNKSRKIVTGNWGCGAFGGHLQIKFFIQWISCTMAGKQMIYCPFGSRSKLNNWNLLQRVNVMSVNEVYQSIVKVGFEVVKEGIPQKDDEIQFFHRLGRYFGIKENFKNTKKT